MQKQTPTLGRLLVILVFALSCFGLLLFLWLSFGGAVPLKPRGYRFKVSFPQAVQLADQADVRTAGISVGTVVAKSLDKRDNRTTATIQLSPRLAPLRCDARATLRLKTLLGETYVELTPGSQSNCHIRENGTLRNANVQPNIYLDQVIQAFDPTTRQAFRYWQQDLAQGATGRGANLNDAFGNLPTFVADGSDVLNILNAQSGAVQRLVRNTGVVFGALSRDTRALHNLVVNAGQVFQTTSNVRNAVAATFRIFPTFEDESKATFTSLQKFALNTDPLIRNLEPVTRDLIPTLRDIHAFAPFLKDTFQKLDPLITASRTGLPALRDFLNGATPLLGALDPFLEQLNPILQFLELYQHQTGDFISNGAASLAASVSGLPNQVGHYLRQIGPTGPEMFAIYQTRPANDRGNTDLGPTALSDPGEAKYFIFPNRDCTNTGAGGNGTTLPDQRPLIGHPGCFVQGPINFQGTSQNFIHVQPDNYSP